MTFTVKVLQRGSSLLFFLSLFTFQPLFAQEEDSIKLFVECNCEKSYIQQEIGFVNHVRDQDLANVKLFIYDIANGSGGRTYKLEFTGKGQFAAVTRKIDFEGNANMTSDDVRKGLVKTIKSGLLKYLVLSDLRDKIDYDIGKEGIKQLQDIDFEDPWNNWLFEISGAAQLDKESSRRNFKYEVGLETDRVTEKWRIRGDFSLSQANSKFISDDEEFTSARQRYFGYGSVVRSINDHWSTGVFAGAEYNTFNNLDLSMNITPAIEFNIFPYKEVLRREIVFAYKIGYVYNNYIETTILGQDSESFFKHSLEVQLRYRQPWGQCIFPFEHLQFFK